MITFKRTSLEDFVKSYNPTPPLHDDINAFEGHIQAFFSRALGDSGEEYQKNEINGFLKKVFDYDCNTKGKIDSAIYVDGVAQVLIEVKALGKSGFPKSPDNPISTALSESILYFLREFHAGNNSIKHIILCTPYEFFIFDAKSFLIFKDDKHIEKLHTNCDAKKGTDTTTKKFYSDLENHLRGDFEGTLPFTYFNLEEAIKSEKDLPLIYQLLSPQVLLKQQKTIDANTLNKKFYDELLYILGLEEKSEGGKTTIVRSGVKNTLADAIKEQYESLSEEEIFALLITWNNRVLFLCLLESMLLGFKHISTRFLNSVVVENFRALSTLFFEVLAKKQNERDSKLESIFKQIPYLNSSLFDKTPLEKEGNEIWRLDSRELALYPTSILKTKDKSQTTLPLLEYYLAFLQAYDFTTTPKDIQDNIKTNHDTLINSAVLGLVFEKLNGYKEGSFYTPSFITSYMCEDAINRAIITRFNAEYGLQCENLKDLKKFFETYVRDEKKIGDSEKIILREDAKKTFLSIHICDPAVGSGHFLVSALNYLIYMAYDLGVVLFRTGTSISLQNDEIILKYGKEIFQYTYDKSFDANCQEIQQSLFNLKKSIIENCLFGVDINPNSCEITKLRLWIELLKHSYYKTENQITNELQTLPNIDINIKCGNSLLSNHPINSPFATSPTKEFTKELADQIQNYKSAVQRYKDSQSSKSEIIKELDGIKAKLIGHLSKNSQTSQSLRKNLEIFFNDYGDEVFDIKTDFGRDMLSIIRKKDFPKQLRTEPTPMDKKGEKLLAQIKKDYEILESMKHNNAFEWRFEFPEVLDNDGNFIGFDCVIGNPPYIDSRKIDPITKTGLSKSYEIYKDSKKGSIFVYFIERSKYLISRDGIISFINPISYICKITDTGIRNFIDKNLRLEKLIDLSYLKVFDSASTYTCINTFTHKKDVASDVIRFERYTDESNLFGQIFQEIPMCKIEDIPLHLDRINQKITQLPTMKIGECCDIFCALSETFRADVTPKQIGRVAPFLETSDIFRYSFQDGKYLKNYQKYFHLKREEIFQNEEVIFMARMTSFIRCCIAPKGYFGGKVNVLHNFKINKFLLLGILNSKLLSFVYEKRFFASHMQGGAFGFDTQSVEQLPIPKIDSNNQSIADSIIALVEEILEKKKQDSATDTTKLESQINKLVYTLYNLTDEEIELIEKG